MAKNENAIITMEHMDKKQLFALLSAPESLDDHIGETITVVGVYREAVTWDAREGDEDGEQREGERTVFLAANGIGYGCGSTGITNALNLLYRIYGDTPWPLDIKIIKKMGRKGYKFTTFEIV